MDQAHALCTLAEDSPMPKMRLRIIQLDIDRQTTSDYITIVSEAEASQRGPMTAPSEPPSGTSSPMCM
ncbi:MAG: hypothetical protein IPK32_23305 [Verrucomicrobiaceae bacterium]|nr:hypothetical protein [Verrucomicrobiaceae bacterium]